MDSLMVLAHSPLVGPFTWSLVARHLQAVVGCDALAPTLSDSGQTPPAYWQQHAASLQRALAPIPHERPVALVGHSGAGPLLPALARAAGHPVTAYLFVDAGLPHPGKSQLGAMEASVPAFARALRQQLVAGERYPNWSDEDLREDLPDALARQRMLAEMQPRPLDFFEEVMPDVPEWPDAPCGYLLLSQGYGPVLEQAQAAGWPSRTIHAGHFHLLVDPAAVAAALVELLEQLDDTRSC
jgi:pimeloyl-ACP methyl ester carboxylesterase